MANNLKSQIFQRLSLDGRWPEAAAIKDRLIKEGRNNGLSRDDAHEAAYRTIDAMFPPADRALQASSNAECFPSKEEIDGDGQKKPEEDGNEGNENERLGDNRFFDELKPAAATVGEPARARGEATVAGLGDIPADWPQLPPNASLGTEVAWVLANRIRIVRESSDGAVVDLSKALTPAPSYAALGWLETSIRAFAKFVDVSARASASGQDDADKIKRERLQIAEIRSLLEQMRQEA